MVIPWTSVVTPLPFNPFIATSVPARLLLLNFVLAIVRQGKFNHRVLTNSYHVSSIVVSARVKLRIDILEKLRFVNDLRLG